MKKGKKASVTNQFLNVHLIYLVGVGGVCVGGGGGGGGAGVVGQRWELSPCWAVLWLGIFKVPCPVVLVSLCIWSN